jgi:hypothetical protein
VLIKFGKEETMNNYNKEDIFKSKDNNSPDIKITGIGTSETLNKKEIFAYLIVNRNKDGNFDTSNENPMRNVDINYIEDNYVKL